MWLHGRLLLLLLLLAPASADDGGLETPFTQSWWISIGSSLGCVAVAALASGLTMGLVGLDPHQLKIIQQTSVMDMSTEEERHTLLREQEYAARLLPLISRHHLLLVTLLLVNAVANEALPIFLDAAVPSYLAVILSVTFVLFFGEIIPSAIFTGPKQLQVAAGCTLLVKACVMLLYPVAWPISAVLDYVFGEEGVRGYKKSELKAIVKLQQDENLSRDEVDIMNAVLDIRERRAKDIMVPLSKTYMISDDAVLDDNLMAEIIAKGHSRVPVYHLHPHNICGLLIVKKLIVVSAEDRRTISSLALRAPLAVGLDIPALELLNEFQKGRSHLAVVCSNPAIVQQCLRSGQMIPPDVHMAGIATIEDVLEEIINEEIADEDDNSYASTKLWQEQRQSLRVVRTLPLPPPQLCAGIITFRDSFLRPHGPKRSLCGHSGWIRL